MKRYLHFCSIVLKHLLFPIVIAFSGGFVQAATLTLTASSSPVAFGQTTTLTVTVSPTAATGRVTFYDGSTVLGTAPISGGMAVLNVAFSVTGNRRLQARFWGSAQDSAATSDTIEEMVGSVPAFGFTSSVLNVGISPLLGAAGDFNGDGKQDLVIAGHSNLLSVILGNGDGTFGSPIFSHFQVDVGASLVAVADFDGDGKADVVLSDATNVKVVFGNGDGTFGSTIVLPTGWGPLVVADFNRDGIPDIAVMHWYKYTSLSKRDRLRVA